jgi:hypothetical protein
VRQEQDGGEGSTNNQAGRDINHITIIEGVTEERARQISQTVSRETVLREGRAVAEAVINERIDYLTGLVFDRIKEEDTSLFNRFEDPRFLAAFTDALRGYGETGDADLAQVLANLVVGLAGQPVRSRREIICRQAITLASQLTTAHVNALSVKLYLAIRLQQPMDTDMLIRALDTLLSPYYGRIPKNRLDFQYMCSMGVCQDGQLGNFASGPFTTLYENYCNSMYPALTFADLSGNLLSSENPSFEENQRLLVGFVENESDLATTPNGKTAVKLDIAKFRVEHDRAMAILSRKNGAEQGLSQPELELRAMILERSISIEQFTQRLAELKPDLASFLREVEKSRAHEFPLQPVGYLLARYEVASRTPQIAALVDAEFDVD